MSDARRAFTHAAESLLRTQLEVNEAVTVDEALRVFGSAKALTGQYAYHVAHGVAQIYEAVDTGDSTMITMVPHTMAVPASEVWVLIRRDA